MRERGFAVIGMVVVAALAVALGFGAVVVLEQSNLVSVAKRSQSRQTLKTHEFLSVYAERNPDNTEVLVRNDGSAPSLAEKVLVREPDDSLSVYDLTPAPVGVLENSVLLVETRVDDNATLGVLTRFGNVFWEGR